MRPFLSLLLLSPLLLSQTNPSQESSISGTVTDRITGLPLTKVQVVAEPTDGRPASTTTDSEGAFTLVHLQPGEYRVSGARNGYLETYYGARRPDSKGTPLTLAAGAETKDLQLKLLPFAAPGRYFMRAGPPGIFQRDDSVDHSPKEARPPEILVPTFHPAAREVESARAIDVAAGDRFTGADVTLLRGRWYRVRVSFEAPAGFSSGVSLSAWPNLSDGLTMQPAGDCKPGICEFAKVPTGAYLARGSAGPTKMTLDDLFSHSPETYASPLVDVTNADVDGVRLVIGAGAEIAGLITVAEGDSAPAKQTHVDFVDAGRYRLGSAAPGGYKLFVWADVEDGIWFDPDFLKDIEGDGHAVTVAAKDVAAKDRQGIDLKLP